MKSLVPSDWDKRKQKDEVRKYAMDGIFDCDHSLWLPGSKAICVSKAISENIIGVDSEIICVERDPEVFADMQRSVLQLLDWRQRPHFHNGELSTLKIKDRLDFCFLDLLGSLDCNLLEWCSSELSKQLKKKSVVCLTVAYSWRSTKRLYNWHHSIEQLDVFSNLKKDLGFSNKYILLPIALMKMALRDWNFEIRWPIKYRDSQRSMIFVRFENFVKSKEVCWPSLDFLSSSIGEYDMSANKSEAAKKAHETRKANALAKKRSEAAKKAWETRRKLVAAT